MTDAPRKRPLFQFSLATAVVMTFVAGGLLWLNIDGKQGKFYVPAYDKLEGNREVTQLYGWPLICSEYMTEEECRRYNGFGDWLFNVPIIYPMAAVLANLVCCLAILATIAVLCERGIRRRERLK